MPYVGGANLAQVLEAASAVARGRWRRTIVAQGARHRGPAATERGDRPAAVAPPPAGRTASSSPAGASKLTRRPIGERFALRCLAGTSYRRCPSRAPSKALSCRDRHDPAERSSQSRWPRPEPDPPVVLVDRPGPPGLAPELAAQRQRPRPRPAGPAVLTRGRLRPCRRLGHRPARRGAGTCALARPAAPRPEAVEHPDRRRRHPDAPRLQPGGRLHRQGERGRPGEDGRHAAVHGPRAPRRLSPRGDHAARRGRRAVRHLRPGADPLRDDRRAPPVRANPSPTGRSWKRSEA